MTLSFKKNLFGKEDLAKYFGSLLVFVHVTLFFAKNFKYLLKNVNHIFKNLQTKIFLKLKLWIKFLTLNWY